MKKLLLAMAAVCMGVAASAQVFIGGNLGFGMNSSNNVTTTVVNTPSSTSKVTLSGPRTSTFEISPKVGYKFNDRMSFGATIGYSIERTFSKTTTPSDDDYLNYCKKKITDAPVFWFSTFFRYNVANFGKCSFFVEASVPHAWAMAEKTHTETDYTVSGNSYHKETDVTSPVKTFSFKIAVTPGFTYEMSKHCSLDLYVDVFGISYNHIRKTKYVETSYGSTKSVDNTHKFYVGVNSLPQNNMFRLGFNYTF